MKIQKLGSDIFQRIKHIGIAALFFGAAILFYACKQNNLTEIKAISAPEELPIMEAANFETTFTDSGQIRFTLKAPKLLRFENEGKTYSEFPNGMEIKKYNANREIISSITADYAKEFIKEEEWEAKNNVIVTNANGDSLKTEHLIWDRKNEKIHTEEFVKIINEDKVITGVGLTSDQDMANWKIKNVKGVLYITVNENKNSPVTETPLEDLNQTRPPDLPKERDANKAVLFK